MLKKSKSLKFLLTWIILLIICVLVRLPHFLSTNFNFDDDEAIIGIMAQDLLSGQGVGYYFYGQNYGVSFFEMLSVAVSMKILGSTIWALRIGGLILYSLGLTFLFKSLNQQKLTKVMCIALVVLLCAFPTWYLWGSLVRGGYVTAFASASAVFYLTHKENRSFWVSPLFGFLVYLTYDAHSFLVLPLLPFLLIWWLKRQHKIVDAVVIASTAFGLFLLAQHFFTSVEASNMIPLDLAGASWKNLSLHLAHWDHSFSGFYYFFAYLEPPFYWLLGIYSFAILFGSTILYLSIQHFKENWIFVVSSVFSLVLGLVILATVPGETPRYMIGIFTTLLFFLLQMIIRHNSRLITLSTAMLAAIALVGVTSGSKMPRHWIEGVNFVQSLEETYKYAKKENVKAVFALDHQFAWNYLYGDDIPATNLCWKNRTMEFSNKVKKQFYADSSKVMLFGMPNYTYGVEESANFENDTILITKELFILRKVRQNHLDSGRVVYPCYETEESRKIPN